MPRSAVHKPILFEPSVLDTDWRRAANPAAIDEALRRDDGHRIRAVCVVHNETSTRCVSPIAGAITNERLGTEFRKIFFGYGGAMGGYGSGKSGGRPTVEDGLTLDLRRLFKSGCVRPGSLTFGTFQLEENDVISEACSSPLGSANSINVKFTTHDVLVVYFSQRFVSD